MSLKVDDSGRRSRSKSPGRRGDERDRSRGRAPDPEPYIMDAVRMPSPPAGFSYDDNPASSRRSAYGHDDPRDSYRVTSPTDESSYRRSREKLGDDSDYDKYSRRPEDRKYKRNGDNGQVRDTDSHRLSRTLEGAASFLPAKYAGKVMEKALSRDSDSEKERKKQEKKSRLEDDLAYGSAVTLPGGYPRDDSPPPSDFQYAKMPQWEMGNNINGNVGYNVTPAQYSGRPLSPPRGDKHSRREPSPGPHRTSSKKHRDEDPRSSRSSNLTVEPGSSSRRNRSRSPAPPVRGMSSLSVGTGHPSGSHLSLANAPGSPLLESYHGTYQSMSPMPSPLLLASSGPLSPIEPLSPGVSDDERGDRKKGRRARFSNPEDDAASLAKALKGDKRAPDVEPLIQILPGLTHEQILDLRAEYKRLVKTGSERKGVNVAKHIRSRLKDEDPLLMKACYTVALGKWESEAYWANFWYQGDKTRREVLIESIMGRTNDEVRMIKDGFSDKKYRDSLTQCIKTELKEDKFKKAVLMVLDERRMEELDEYGRPLPIDRGLVEDDVHDLRKAVKSERGGETAMIQIIVMRSDSHLRDVLKLYERTYGGNFARDALKKSGNLVVSWTLS